MNRRTALKTLAAGATLPLLAPRAFAASSAAGAPLASSPSPPAPTIGPASISLKVLPLDQMLAMTRRLGFDSISLHRAHSPWENQPAQWKETGDKIRAAGVTPRCCGVIYLKNDEPATRRMMEYVKAHGLGFFSCSPEPAALPLLEKLVREYDLRCAIHNHGPEDKSWPSVAGVMQAIEPLDPRVGLCLDVGHCYRSGENPAEMVERCRTRLYDVHLKDSMAAVGDVKDIPVELGRGRLDLRGVLQALARVNYTGGVWLEYEKDPNDPVPGLAECAGYVRGLLAG